jgi:chemotaxis protein MotB
MATSKEKKIIIVRKVKKGHAAHHGGSWKVAYADFVTAMMAFFMVMWILGMDDQVKQAIEGYFTNPVGMKQGYSSGSSPISSGASPSAVRTTPIRVITRNFEDQRFRDIAKRIEKRLHDEKGLGAAASNVQIVITKQGLRIELVEGPDGETFFAFGSAALKPAASRALSLIGEELSESGTGIVVEGHTDSAPFGSPGYSNWELSSDRANAARRVLDAHGLSGGRIREVRGYADTDLRNPDNPLDRTNRRISILLPFSTPAPSPNVPGTEVVPAS